MKTPNIEKPTLTRFALLLFSLALAASAHATAYVSNASGNLSTTTIWTPNGTPGASDTVEVKSGNLVTNNSSASTVGGVIVDSGGTFSVGASQTVGWVTNGGTFQIGNNTTARTLTIAGSITNRGTINTASTSPTHSIIFSANSSWVGSGDISGVKANVTINSAVTLDISGITNALTYKTSFGTTTTVSGTLIVGSTVIDQANSGATMTFASGSTLALNVGGAGEYTDANIGTLSSSGQLNTTKLGTLTLATGAVLSLNPINASSSTFTCNSTIGGANSFGLYEPGTGTLILGGNNTFAGPVTLPNAANTTAGWILVASSTALGPDATSKTINLTSSTSGATGGIQLSNEVTVNNKNINIGGRTAVSTSRFLQNLSGSNIWNGNLTIANSGGNYYIESDAGTLVLGGTLENNVNLNRGFILQGAGNGIISGSVVDASGTVNTYLNFSGPGTWSLTGPNTFTGGTTIAGGKLIVSGQSSPNSGTGSGAVAVNAGTLSGNGRVGGNVTVANSATAILYPNISGGGTLTLGGTLTFSGASSVAKFNLSTTAGGANDKVVMENQSVTITGSPQITINLASTTLDAADYVLIDAGSGSVSGSFNVTPVFTGSTPKYSGQYSIVTSAHQVKLHYTPIALTVTANSGQTKIYGASDPMLTYTLTTGSLVTGDSFSGALSRAAGENVGSYAIAQGALTAGNYYGITFNTANFAITAKSASVTADAKSKTYGDVNPTLTAVTNGAVNGDVINVTLVTDATQFSNVGVSNIFVVAGSNPNYTVLTTNSTLTINKASTFVGASSSENPSGYKDAISFTATLPTNATGNVVFSSTNGPISTNTLSRGTTTSLSITNLPRGTNLVTVAYLGDGNYVGSTNTLNQIVTNHPPAVTVMTVTRTAGLALIISLSDVATNWTDNPDGDHVSLTGVTMQSTNGVNLFPLNWSTNLDGSIVTTNAYAYIGYTNSPNVNDQINYGISDGQGGTNIGYLNIVIQGSVTGTNSITTYNFTNPTSNTVTAYGIPYFYYILERSTNLSSPVWVDVQTNQAAPNGLINMTDQFIDLGGVKPSPAFYQLKWQP